MQESDVVRVRSFNRLIARQIGALNDRYLGGRPLGESRVLFEVGADGGATPRDIRTRLGLDSGYVSRMIASLERDGLVKRAPNPADGRTPLITATAKGRKRMRDLDARSDELAASTLAPLTAGERERLLVAQDEVRRLTALSMLTIGPEDATSGDARWCLGHYFADLDAMFENGFELQPGEYAADPKGVFLMARLGGQPAGCGVITEIAPGVGEIKRMWIDQAHRGLGLAKRLLQALEDTAREKGFHTIRLDTNKALEPAKAMYRSAGYREIERYNDNPYAYHWFEKNL
jgi:DNA-binding MarR family transcriptional regulator/GNAT superfamily N-acetyltransferase